jgi:serine/threonine-protein kinase RsbW
VKWPACQEAYSVPDLLTSAEKGFHPDANPNHGLDVSIPSDPVEARRVQDAIEALLKSHQFAERDIFCIKLALEEALVNAIKHGNQMDRTKKVTISYQVAADCFAVRIADEGLGFNPSDVPDPVAVENLERPCGRGLLLMRHYMTEVTFQPPGNCVCMTKVRNPAHRNGHP